MASGWTAEHIFGNSTQGYTFDDFLLMPGRIDFDLASISLETRLTRKLFLKNPILSSPMDTVTEHSMAIGCALLGGIGILHNNMTLEKQISEVECIKRYENGFITEPFVLSPNNTIADIDEIKVKHGYSTVPITVDGKLRSKLLGIVTNRDHDFVLDRSTPLRDIMTTDLIVGKNTTSLSEAYTLLRESKKGKLPIVNKEFELVSLVSRNDLKKERDFPLASKNENSQLRCGAALSTKGDALYRAKALLEAGTDVLIIDSSQGNSIYQIDTIKQLKQRFPDVQIIAGNVITVNQSKSLLDAGADGLRIGMGSGSICTTQSVCAVGRAQGSAIYHVCKYAKEYGDIPCIADGGIRTSGNILQALSFGASCVMCGSMLAGTEEAPGDFHFHDGLRIKRYRGMGSIDAMTSAAKAHGEGSQARYFSSKSQILVAQGVSGAVVDKGSIFKLIPHILQGIKHGMQDIGQSSISGLHKAMYEGDLTFELRSVAAQREGDVHDILTL
ncbi:IMP dehydrogenase [Cardiosporidium cionae]|uniref:Inosine-5'-monophosphate dehydrogenase n=1 Tax=Cardiosporidium cionae TaxID=476202 RepID=A0A3Q8UBG0_9APIC|nr:inosine-5-monophosphate dehydrogenase [Cardiosporidium cionae]KAF8819236.1 IMP dehydrogenase [Cardiosporidium cionae]|eukprot:KAF8819236.1 IMP dehydrogenase [Cardiosporidium cionae]